MNVNRTQTCTVSKSISNKCQGSGSNKSLGISHPAFAGRSNRMDDASKQMVRSLKSEIANLEEVIQANTSRIAALEKELITEKGNPNYKELSPIINLMCRLKGHSYWANF